MSNGKSSPTIHNNSNVYILGAGFSRDANMPLVRDFLDRMRESVDWLTATNPPRAQERLDHIAKVFEFRLRAAGAAHRININIEDIEQLFSLASATENDDFFISIKESIASTLDFCAQTRKAEPDEISVPQVHAARFSADLKRRTGNSPNWTSIQLPSRYEDYVSRLIGLCSKHYMPEENTFITFNYDTVLEQAIWNLGYKISYAMDRVGREHVRQLVADDGISVLKLHGSINWSEPGTSGQQLKIYPDYTECLQFGSGRFLVPPTWQKDLKGPYQKIWNAAIDAIHNASRIIIIGFSMPETDTHFKYLLSAGLQSNISVRQVQFIDPTPVNEFSPKIRKLFSQASIEQGFVTHHAKTIDEFFREPEHREWINRPLYNP